MLPGQPGGGNSGGVFIFVLWDVLLFPVSSIIFSTALFSQGQMFSRNESRYEVSPPRFAKRTQGRLLNIINTAASPMTDSGLCDHHDSVRVSPIVSCGTTECLTSNHLCGAVGRTLATPDVALISRCGQDSGPNLTLWAGLCGQDSGYA